MSKQFIFFRRRFELDKLQNFKKIDKKIKLILIVRN